CRSVRAGPRKLFAEELQIEWHRNTCRRRKVSNQSHGRAPGGDTHASTRQVSRRRKHSPGKAAATRCKCVQPDGPPNGNQPLNSRDKSHVTGGWLPSLTFAFAEIKAGAKAVRIR